MGAPVPAETFESAHRDAVDRANSWRGRCINLFARGERAVAQALMTANKPGKVPQLLGQKLERLANDSSDRPEVLKAIDGFRPYMEIRNLIVHYEAHVFADLKEGWLVQFDDWSGEVLGRYSDIEAEAIRKEVQSAVDRLISRLR